MRYNKRCFLLRYEEVNGLLGNNRVLIEREEIACAQSATGVSESVGVFGCYQGSAFKLFLQGCPRPFKQVEYDGKVYDFALIKCLSRSTVVIMS